MFSVRQIASKQLVQKNAYCLGFGKKRKPTPTDLPKYDVVVVGANLGSVFAHHLDAVVGEKYKIYVSYDNPSNPYYADRNLYEQGVYLSLYQESPSSISPLPPEPSSAKTLPTPTLLELRRSTPTAAKSP